MRMRVRMLMMIVLVNVTRFTVRMVVRGRIVVFDDDIDLGSGKAAAAYLAHLETCANVQCGSCLFKQGKGHARIYKRAKQHVAADAGEALQISDSHGNEIVPRTGLVRRVHQIARCLGPVLLSGPILPV